MPSVTSLGAGSGLELEDIVTKLVAAERDPATARLDRKEEALNVELSAFGTLKSDLVALEESSLSLNLPSQMSNRAASASTTTVLDVSADNTAAAGTYDVVVNNLAESHKIHSSTFATTATTVGTGTLTLEFGTYNGDQTSFSANASLSSRTITIGSASQSLDGVRNAINSARAGVTATIIHDGSGYRLSVVSDNTGADYGIKLSADDADGNDTDSSGLSQLVFTESTKNMINTMAAEDAALTINGLSVTSSSNTLTEAIQGVTLDLKTEASTTVTVAQDATELKTAIETFVTNYNSLSVNLKVFTDYDTSTGSAGVLLGDSVARSLESQMRTIAFSVVKTTAGNNMSLAALGIKTNAFGIMEIDEETLDSVLKSSYDDVTDLFAKAGVGVAKRMEDFSDDATKSTGGLVTDRTNRLSSAIRDLKDDRIKLEERLEGIEARYRAQFTNLDLLLADLNSTSEYLEGQLKSLASLNNGND
jgi:flagellar hook-associated protein 2